MLSNPFCHVEDTVKIQLFMNHEVNPHQKLSLLAF